MITYDQLTTVIMPTSPSPSHPNTRITDETLASVRHWFPTAPIHILADGVRPELEHRRTSYYAYLRRLNHTAPANTHFFVNAAHAHQTTLLKMELDRIDSIGTPLMLWIENDLPIRTDVYTDWQMMADAILSGDVDLCRLMLHESVHPEHEHLYQPSIFGQPALPNYPHLRPQKQFSGWTHLAYIGMYRRLLRGFDARARIMIERFAVRVIEAHPWTDFKLTSYIPDPVAARRIYHLHGRGGVDGQPDDHHFSEQECYPPK